MLILPLFLLKFDKDRLNYFGIDEKYQGQNILLPVFLSNLQKKWTSGKKLFFCFEISVPGDLTHVTAVVLLRIG